MGTTFYLSSTQSVITSDLSSEDPQSTSGFVHGQAPMPRYVGATKVWPSVEELYMSQASVEYEVIEDSIEDPF